MTYALDKQNAIFLGVCAGFARMTNTDALWWRLGAVLATLAGFGSPVIIYLLIGWLAQPREPRFDA